MSETLTATTIIDPIDRDVALESATPIVIVGHVDHGKSTLIGRLLYDTNNLEDGKVAQILESSKKRGLAIEWSFLLDSLQIERDQGVTVDSTRIPFRLGNRQFVIVDAPGHRQFLRNMITGAADADAAVLVVDANEGAQEQTRRHAMLLRLIGIRHIVVLLNKVDLLDFDEQKVRAVENSVTELLTQLELTPSLFVPASARDGDNIASRSERSPWYKGPILTEALAAVPDGNIRATLPFRLPVQDVYRFDDKRYVVGRIERGTLRVGDELTIGSQGSTARVAAIERWSAPERKDASAGESVALVLEPDVIPARGDFLFAPHQAPEKSARIRANLFWLRQEPLRVGETFRLRLATAEHQVTVASIDSVVRLDDLTTQQSDEVPPEGFAEITLVAGEAILFDPFSPGTSDGRGVLVDRNQRIVGGAPLLGPATLAAGSHAIHPSGGEVSGSERARGKGHKARVIWLTGLSGAGKSTIARLAERKLWADGIDACVLDGDTLRMGLCSDLGFTEADRHENVRRAAEVARILAQTGQVVIVALISPLEADRGLARRIAGVAFDEVFVDTSLATCEERDSKGLYRAAREGKIENFTGISAPYEAPAKPDLHIIADKSNAEQNAVTLTDYILRKIR
ncbi:adenylyl-sulfate kinase [Acetobacter fallax]|uniref:Adenylyl-sulfate kinase n=1 Tax=Acetobacter fallax TaxID=1737473 RepID=A0ABX0K766_9PROT|nr:adenylyl-sulfate kinase [Acetobacter fallax]NHO31101.1 adenylyl-sulfate kinase [Acetobacter fallax]NHO34658.1 adenylyl-sulfate kinase [Acetobacter fallax]